MEPILKEGLMSFRIKDNKMRQQYTFYYFDRYLMLLQTSFRPCITRK